MLCLLFISLREYYLRNMASTLPLLHRLGSEHHWCWLTSVHHWSSITTWVASCSICRGRRLWHAMIDRHHDDMVVLGCGLRWLHVHVSGSCVTGRNILVRSRSWLIAGCIQWMLRLHYLLAAQCRSLAAMGGTSVNSFSSTNRHTRYLQHCSQIRFCSNFFILTSFWLTKLTAMVLHWHFLIIMRK